MILFFFLCFFCYDQAVKKKNQEEHQLRTKLNTLNLAKKEALLIQEELRQEITSQTDEAWIELTLMQHLGLVPDGQTKVHFLKQ